MNLIFTPQAKVTNFSLEEGVLSDTLLPDYPNNRENDRPHQITAITSWQCVVSKGTNQFSKTIIYIYLINKKGYIRSKKLKMFYLCTYNTNREAVLTGELALIFCI
jgi:hypothetical protein